MDKVAFRQAPALPHEDTIYVLLMDRGWLIFWRAEGEYSVRPPPTWDWLSLDRAS